MEGDDNLKIHLKYYETRWSLNNYIFVVINNNKPICQSSSMDL